MSFHPLSGLWWLKSTAVISVKCSRTRGPCRIRHRINHNDRGAVRDLHRRRTVNLSGPEELALLAAQILKSRNPNSVVRLKDLETGAEIVIAFKRGNNNGMLTLLIARRTGSSSRTRRHPR